MAKSKAAVAGTMERALAFGNMEELARIVTELTAEERTSLREEWGDAAFERTTRAARHVRRGGQKGRVVVVNGIMGARLAVSEDGGTPRDVWLRLLKLMGGGFSSLQLGKGGKPNPRLHVTPVALFKDYVPLVLELHKEWRVLPFPFDWRRDLLESADELDQRLRAWAGTEPVHIVAHSMGGLLARAFIMRHPGTWQAIADPDGLRRGGRLVMLGTPNRGSFAIPSVLTGKETLVKALAATDVSGSMDDVLSVLGTFPGVYQMLPSPTMRGVDDRERLFDRKSYAGKHVDSELLARGRRFQSDLEPVVDPERFLYVAGYNQKTPCRIQIDGPSDFKYVYTNAGDGRVPHELGVLAGVPTFWIEESHGALPKAEGVLEGIHELLSTGRTESLESARPVQRGTTIDNRFRSPEEAGDENVRDPSTTRRKRAKGSPAFTVAEAATRERQALRGWVGAVPKKPAFGVVAAEVARTAGEPLTLPVDVWWGNIQEVPADAYVCGHYENVLPRAAEAALDALVSAEDALPEEGLLFQLTQRGLLPGDLGMVHIYPWANAHFLKAGGASARGRIVALAGMGRVGEFEPRHLRTLSRNLTWVLGSLENVRTVASVVIGSGAGNMDLRTAITSMLEGVDDALRLRDVNVQIDRLIFVEFELGRARRLHAHLKGIAAERDKQRASLRLGLNPRLTIGTGGNVSETDVIEEALCEIGKEPPNSVLLGRVGKRLETLLGPGRAAGPVLESALAELRKSIDQQGDFSAGRLRVQTFDEEGESAGQGATWSDRIACVAENKSLSVSILTSAAIVPKRVNPTSWSVFEEAMDKLVDPQRASAVKYGGFVMQQLFEADVRAHLSRDESIVFEVDRTTASLPWELLAFEGGDDTKRAFLALRRNVARQLRTEYAAPLTSSRANEEIRHVLIIGDPGAPELGDSLDGARREALAVYHLLRELNPALRVSLLIGAESVARSGELAGTKPATRVEVLSQLMKGDVDLVHYAGHGDFDEKDPQRRGWVFAGRNERGDIETQHLTARELYGVGAAPRLIVANACLSGLTSQRTAAGRLRPGGRDLALLPSLADEFFKRGVRHYIGTAWPVSDGGAVVFAEHFYRALLKNDDTVGDAVRAGRIALWERSASFDELWSAYQHYGDPTQRMGQPSAQRRARMTQTFAAIKADKTNDKANPAVKPKRKSRAAKPGRRKAAKKGGAVTRRVAGTRPAKPKRKRGGARPARAAGKR